VKAIDAGAGPRLHEARPRGHRRPEVTRGGLRRAALHEISILALALALLNTVLLVRWGIDNNVLAFDFRGTLWDAAIAVREGHSPYPAPVVDEVRVGNPAVYPPLLMLLVAPLTFLPWAVGATLWTCALCAGVAGALYVLGVRDLRCYAFAFLTNLVVTGLVFGNATLLLVPLVALAWRWRDQWARVGACVGLVIASKLFLWPLLFWLLGTRRYRAFGAAIAIALAAVVLPWAVIGFAGMSTYPDLLRVAEEVYAVHSYSIATMLSALGTETELAARAALAVGLGLAAAAFYVGRRRADSVSLSVAVLAAILGSPIVWPFYYALLLVPLAIARPRFSALWLLPGLFYFAYRLPRPRLSSSAVEPGGSAWPVPSDVPLASWIFSHAPPGLWPAVGHGLIASALVALGAWAVLQARSRRPEHARSVES
jgi:hypothetical protein